MEEVNIDWIVDKASELLMDKVQEGPLGEKDVGLAFAMTAERRLEKMSESFSDEEEYKDAKDEVKVKLREVALELNEEYWSDKKLLS